MREFQAVLDETGDLLHRAGAREPRSIEVALARLKSGFSGAGSPGRAPEPAGEPVGEPVGEPGQRPPVAGPRRNASSG